MMLLDQDLKSIRAGPTTRALPFLAPREPDPQGLGKGASWSEPQDWGVLSRFQTSSLPRPGLIKNSRRGNKLSPRILKRLKRWERDDPSRVPALTCSLRESPSVSSSRPSCTSGSSSPCGVTALGGSTLPSHVFWPSFSENQVGDSKFEVCLLPLDGLPYSATAIDFMPTSWAHEL